MRGVSLAGFVGFSLLAACLRFPSLDLMEFKSDEVAMHVRAAAVSGGHFPLSGIFSSLGVPNPPAAVYAFSLGGWASDDPLHMAGVSALLGSLAAGVTFLLGRRFFGWQVGCLAALIVSLSPWAILLSRKIWAQDLLPFFSVSLMYWLLDWWERPQARAAVLVPLLLALLLQIHFSAAIFIPLVLAAVALRQGQKYLLWWGVGAGLAALTFVPFALFLVDFGASDYLAMIVGSSRNMSLTSMLARGAMHFLDMADFGSLGYVSRDAASNFMREPGALPWTRWIQVPMLVAGTGAALFSARTQAGRWLVAWAGASIFGFAFGARAPHPHYLAPALPCTALLMALAIVPARAQGRRVAWLCAGLFLLLGAANLHFTHVSRAEVAAGQWKGDSGIPYRDSLEGARFLAARFGTDEPVELAATKEHFAVAYLAHRLGLDIPVPAGRVTGKNWVAVCVGPSRELPRRPAVETWRSESGALRIGLLAPSDLR